MVKANPDKHRCCTGMRDIAGVHKSPLGLMLVSDQRGDIRNAHAMQITISLNHRCGSRS